MIDPTKDPNRPLAKAAPDDPRIECLDALVGRGTGFASMALPMLDERDPVRIALRDKRSPGLTPESFMAGEIEAERERVRVARIVLGGTAMVVALLLTIPSASTSGTAHILYAVLAVLSTLLGIGTLFAACRVSTKAAVASFTNRSRWRNRKESRT